MKKQLYLECAAGISGDMAVAALLDLGASEERLREVLSSLPVEDSYEIAISRVKKAGLDTCDFDVILPEEQNPHDHDIAYLHEYESHTHKHWNLVEGGQAHEGQEAQTQKHLQRGPEEIHRIFHASAMSVGAKALADRILDIIAEAEAKAHGVSVEQVHFHEVGAIDSILDMASFAICFDELQQKYQWEDVIVKSITEGQGTVRCQHGILPIPVPAVTNIAMKYELPLRVSQVEGELVTPTGAAIAAAVTTTHQLPEELHIVATGLGAGKRAYKTAGFLRILLLETC